MNFHAVLDRFLPLIKKRRKLFENGRKHDEEESLEHIRESAETRMRKNAFMLHNYIELERVEKDRAVFSWLSRPRAATPWADSWRRHLHPGGQRHGARRPTATGGIASQTSALHFLRNQATGTVRASAWVRHRGKSTVLTAVDITGVAAGCWPRGVHLLSV